MYRSHRLAVDINTRAGKIISKKLELGFRFDYDYRFIKTIPKHLLPLKAQWQKGLYTVILVYSVLNQLFSLI